MQESTLAYLQKPWKMVQASWLEGVQVDISKLEDEIKRLLFWRDSS